MHGKASDLKVALVGKQVLLSDTVIEFLEILYRPEIDLYRVCREIGLFQERFKCAVCHLLLTVLLCRLPTSVLAAHDSEKSRGLLKKFIQFFKLTNSFLLLFNSFVRCLELPSNI